MSRTSPWWRSRKVGQQEGVQSCGGQEELGEGAPIADAAQQVSSAVLVKVMSAGLACCVVLGPVGAVLGGLAWMQMDRAQAAPVVAARDTSGQQAAAGAFAEQVVRTWLGATQNNQSSSASLQGLVADPSILVMSQTPFSPTDLAVAGISGSDGTWTVTVGATVTDARKVTARRYFQVPVADVGGVLSALTLPVPVAAPKVAASSTAGYDTLVDPSSALGQAVSQFLSAYLTGNADVSRYTTPGVALIAITPAPYASVKLQALHVADHPSPLSNSPSDGTRVRVLAIADGVVTDQQSSVLMYALTLTARAGRWEITAIDASPVEPSALSVGAAGRGSSGSPSGASFGGVPAASPSSGSPGDSPSSSADSADVVPGAQPSSSSAGEAQPAASTSPPAGS